MLNILRHAKQNYKFLTGRVFFTSVLMGAIFTLALALQMVATNVSAAIPIGPALSTPPPPFPTPIPLPPPQYGVNIDVPFDMDEICGFEIILISDVKPQSIYNGIANPWGAPTIINEPVGSNRWKLTFGNPDGSGPCFSKNDSRFIRSNGTYLGLHFGFYVSEPVTNFDFNCWFIDGEGNYVSCNVPITGHKWVRHGWTVLNPRDLDLAIENVRAALFDAPVHINDLMPVLTEGGIRLQLEDNFVPAARGDEPGTLFIELPAELQGQRGHVVVSYDVRDIENPEQFSTVTLAAPLQ